VKTAPLLVLLLLLPGTCPGLTAPVLIGPGAPNAPGPELEAQTVHLQWQPAEGAGGYRVFVRDLTAGTAQPYDLSPTDTELAATLVGGDRYGWDMAALAGTNEGPLSGTLYFQIKLAPEKPQITGVSPFPVPAIDAAQVFTVHGNSLMRGSEVVLRQRDSGETFRGRKQIHRHYRFVSILADFTSDPGHWSVEVINPGGLSSGEFYFPVVPASQIPAWRWWRSGWPWAWAGLIAFCTTGTFWWWTARRRLPRALATMRDQTQREERQRLVRDLHDRASADIARLAQLADEAALQSTSFPAAAQQCAREIAAAARDAETAIGDLLWAADPQSERLPQLAARLRVRIRDRLKPHGVEPDFSAWPAPVPNRAVNAAVASQILHLSHEVLNNVVKHARATKLVSEICVDGDWLVLGFRDNGQGFQPHSQPAGGRGLANMRARVQRFGGSVELKFMSGQGTEVIIRLPLGQDRATAA
jgi:signal transduction histidine kinase